MCKKSNIHRHRHSTQTQIVLSFAVSLNIIVDAIPLRATQLLNIKFDSIANCDLISHIPLMIA